MIWDHVFSVWGMLIVGILSMALWGICDTIARNWRRACEAEIAGALKAEMIKQGRSADEIARILKSSSGDRAPAAAE
jgi:hypothetical protein